MNKKLLLPILVLTTLFFSCSSVNNKVIVPVTNADDILHNQDTLFSLNQLLHKGLQDSAYPGFVCLAAKDGNTFYYENGGNFTYDKNSQSMDKSTIFDLASLTKVISTTSAAMLLYDRGELDLDSKVVDYYPEFGDHSKEIITVRHLLLHNSGLPAHVRLWEGTNNSSEMFQKVCNLELQYEPGSKSVYSCIGFITLGKVIEKITNQDLATFVSENIFEPLHMDSTFYNPDEKYLSSIAPTELDSTRGGVLVGKVHDENAYYLDGISGNAGLFSTAEDLSIFCNMLVNKGSYNGVKIFTPETVELFTSKKNNPEGSSRCLGWDSPSGNSSSGHYYSVGSFGHTGYTGTSIWIDPHKKMFGIFLTNRVHPTRLNRKMYKMRYKVYDLLQQSITDFPL